MNNCFVCGRIEQIKDGTNPFFVTELNTGYVVLGDFQFFNGYTVFLSKNHCTELHQLSSTERALFLQEMSLVAEAVFNAFKPVKMNYELLGNSDSHLHWHLFPRHADDPRPRGPVWLIDKELRNGDSARPTKEELIVLRDKLQHELSRLEILFKSL